jgi:methyl-accepting chemotaxis protein
MAWINRIGVLPRLCMICLVLTVPIALPTVLFVSQSWKDISFARQELRGTAYLESIWAVFTGLARSGAVDRPTLDRAVGHWKAKAAEYDATLDAGVASAAFAAGVGGFRADHRAEALAAGQALIAKVGDASNLILDPDLDSYYAMDIVVVKAPQLAAVGSDLYEALLAARGKARIGFDDVLTLVGKLGEYDVAQTGLESSLEAAMRESKDGSVRRALEEPGRRLSAASRTLLEALRPIVRSTVQEGDASGLERILQPLNGMQAALDEFWHSAATDLARLLQTRIDGFQTKLMQSLALIAVFLLIAAALVVAVTRSITRPVGALIGTLDRMRHGELSLHVPFTDLPNEIGEISRSIVYLRDGVSAMRERDMIETTRRTEDANRQTLKQMAERVEAETSKGLDGIVASADRTRSKSDDMRATLAGVVSATGAAGTNAREARTLAEEALAISTNMIQSIGDVDRLVGAAAETTAKAVGQAETSRAGVSALARAAEEISASVDAIAAIAAQTNLLALNATIEAARAGAAGRGFAIVATEVKALAAETAKTTSEISGKVAEIQTRTRDAVEIIGAFGGTIGTLSACTGTIGEAMVQQRSMTGEFQRIIGETNRATGDLDAKVASIATLSSQSSKLAEDVRGLADEMTGTSAQIRSAVPNIVAEARRNIERRMAERIHWSARVDGMVGTERRQLTASELSLRGVRIDAAYPVGTVVRLSLPASGPVDGRVVWSDGKSSSGLQFDRELPARALRAVLDTEQAA